MEHTIELTFGYEDKKGTVHKAVTFGKRPKLGDLIALDVDPQAQIPTQYQRLIRRSMITKFGTLPIPVALGVMLALDTVDDDAIAEGEMEFQRLSRDGREGRFGESETKLMFGVEIGGITYDTVQFGNRLTVNDYVEADKLKLGDGISRAAFLAGRQVSLLTDSNSGATREGALLVDEMAGMDGEDFNILRIAAEFFRLGVAGTGKATGRSDAGDPADSKGDGLDGERDPKAAGGEV